MEEQKVEMSVLLESWNLRNLPRLLSSTHSRQCLTLVPVDAVCGSPASKQSTNNHLPKRAEGDSAVIVTAMVKGQVETTDREERSVRPLEGVTN